MGRISDDAYDCCGYTEELRRDGETLIIRTTPRRNRQAIRLDVEPLTTQKDNRLLNCPCKRGVDRIRTGK